MIDNLNSSKVFRRQSNEQNLIVKSGYHVYLQDADNKRFLDAISGSLVASLGYGNSEIIDEMNSQAKKLSYVHNARFTNDEQEKLALNLSSFLNFEYKAYFCGSGSEVVDASIRVQYAYNKCIESKKKDVLSFSESYHGSGIGALNLSGIKRIKDFYLELFPNDIDNIEDCCLDSNNCKCNTISSSKFINIGAIIFEPISANVLGSKLRCPNLINRIIELKKELGFLIIVDEIATSISRTGKDFAFQYFENFKPDIICLSKILGAGYTNIGCMLVHKNIYAVIENLNINILGNTYNGNPIACAVGNKVIEILKRENYTEVNSIRGEILINDLKNVSKDSEFVHSIRGYGLLIAVEMRNNGKIFSESENSSKKISNYFLQNGLIVLPGTGNYINRSDHILIAPAYTFKQEDYDQLLDLFKKNIYSNKLKELMN